MNVYKFWNISFVFKGIYIRELFPMTILWLKYITSQDSWNLLEWGKSICVWGFPNLQALSKLRLHLYLIGWPHRGGPVGPQLAWPVWAGWTPQCGPSFMWWPHMFDKTSFKSEFKLVSQGKRILTLPRAYLPGAWFQRWALFYWVLTPIFNYDPRWRCCKLA